MLKPSQISKILGYASDPNIAEKLHVLAHRSLVEYLTIDAADVQRQRIRRTTDRGTDCAIALPRNQRLRDGAVLKLDHDGAIVVRLTEEQWLTIEPCDKASALEFGYFAGNLHWRVKFQDGRLKIALEGPKQDYIARLRPFLESNRVREVEND